MSGVFQNIDPSPPGECVPPPPAFGAGGGHTRWVERGWGVNSSETPDTALYSMYVSTLCFSHKASKERTYNLLNLCIFSFLLFSVSRVHECTFSLRFLGIILWVLRLEVFVYNVYFTNQFQTTFYVLLAFYSIFSKPNSWMYNFTYVSGHNLVSSQAWGFRIQCLLYKPVPNPNHFCSGGGGGRKSVSRSDCEWQGGKLLRLLSQWRPRFGPVR